VKSAGAVRHQLKQVRYRHLKKRLENELRRFPHNCAHNRNFNHPKVIADGGDPCGVCTHANQEGSILCDLAWGGYQRAKDCPLFEHRMTKDEVKDGFKEWLSTAKLHEIASEYPDMAALMWVLQEEAPDREVEIEDGEDWEPDADTDEEPPPPAPAVNVRDQVVRVASDEDAEALGAVMAVLDEEVTKLRSDLEAKGRDHEHVAAQLQALRDEQAKQAEVVLAPRVSWWRRLFGSGP
jgi:Tfp pilus assembly protein FimV